MTQPQGSAPNTTTFDQLLQPIKDLLDELEAQRTIHHLARIIHQLKK